MNATSKIAIFFSKNIWNTLKSKQFVNTYFIMPLEFRKLGITISNKNDKEYSEDKEKYLFKWITLATTPFLPSTLAV